MISNVNTKLGTTGDFYVDKQGNVLAGKPGEPSVPKVHGASVEAPNVDPALPQKPSLVERYATWMAEKGPALPADPKGVLAIVSCPAAAVDGNLTLGMQAQDSANWNAVSMMAHLRCFVEALEVLQGCRVPDAPEHCFQGSHPGQRQARRLHDYRQECQGRVRLRCVA
jgi:hypothetical protein